jgi:hypothetical protein
MKSLVGISVLAAALALAGKTYGAEAAIKEDLAACKLPHGEVLLPGRDTLEGREGFVLRFMDGKLTVLPRIENPQSKSIKEMQDIFRAQNVGDVAYSPLNEGGLMAISCRMADLGSQLLSDLSGRKFERPPVVESQKERSGGRPSPGKIDTVLDGHCYLVESADGKFGLVRVVQKRGQYALIQYVYQPSGEAVFDIPKGQTIKVEPEPVRTSPPMVLPPPPASVPGKVTDVPTLLEIRQKMIVELMATVAKQAKTTDEILAKSSAIAALGRLRAAEAAPLLVQEIDFFGSAEVRSVDEFNIEQEFGCVKALQEISKPGSLAALDAIGKLKLDGLAPEEAKKAQLRLKLLVLVIKGVEGPEVAAFMIKSKATQASGPAKTALEAALKELQG